MLITEAILLQSLVDTIKPRRILDCGSGTRADRTIVQPHIAAVYAGYDVVWTNTHSPNGTELVCDFTKPETLVDLPRCPLVTCSAMLEHVEDIDGALSCIVSLVDDWFIVTAPRTYPLHNCPIDNGWRPTPDELAEKVASLGLEIMQKYVTGPERFGDVEDASMSIVLARNTVA
jgi:hypothetical protein